MILQICVWNPWNKTCLLPLSELLVSSCFFCLCWCCDNYILSAMILQICVWNQWNKTCLLALSELFMCSHPGVRFALKIGCCVALQPARSLCVMQCQITKPDITDQVVVPSCDDISANSHAFLNQWYQCASLTYFGMCCVCRVRSCGWTRSRFSHVQLFDAVQTASVCFLLYLGLT